MQTGLATTDFWDSQNNAYQLQIAGADDPIVSYMKDVDFSSLNSCFEVGCFPGGYLAYLGKRGLEVNGIDFSERILTDLEPYLREQQLKVGTLLQGDFFKMQLSQTFDLVCSFGFVEHFENWDKVIDLHAQLVSTNGYLVITTPNFRGRWQKLIHKYLDKKNYNRHYIPSMRPDLWKEQLERSGFTIVKQGYFGRFDFWVEEEPPLFLKPAIIILRRLKPLLRKLLPGNKESYSPFCGIIAKKTKPGHSHVS